MNENIGSPIPPSYEEPKKKNVGLIIAVVAIVLLCCCVVVAGAGWWLWNNGDALFGLAKSIVPFVL
ncbi:MAG: hypothetical protein GXP40_01620 [Chloroflexi bacterium]|nr:hypothetical protein [Chloroflexota bacterium]